MEVVLHGITKIFGGIHVVKDVNMEIHEGEFVALLGPSGCGKTTTLLIVAGIYKPSSGTIEFDGKVVNQIPPKDRHIGMVFQSYALYPHMTVYQNLVFPLILKKRPKREMQREAQRLAEMLGIIDLMERKPSMLSGGQQQRVALGRALIKKPKILLFDEPLSNLDARLRMTMRAEIKRIQKELGITSIYVTHDQVEAMTMADRIAVMKDGILQSYTTPETLHERPRTVFIAEFIGNPPMNILEVILEEKRGEMFAWIGNVSLAIPSSRRPKKSAKSVKMGIRPQDIILGDEEGHPADVYLVELMGRDDLVICTIGESKISVLADSKHKIKMGDKVKLWFSMEYAQFFDSDTEESLLWLE